MGVATALEHLLSHPWMLCWVPGLAHGSWADTLADAVSFGQCTSTSGSGVGRNLASPAAWVVGCLEGKSALFHSEHVSAYSHQRCVKVVEPRALRRSVVTFKLHPGQRAQTCIHSGCVYGRCFLPWSPGMLNLFRNTCFLICPCLFPMLLIFLRVCLCYFYWSVGIPSLVFILLCQLCVLWKHFLPLL